MSAATVTYFDLPWATGRADRRTFRRWLTLMLVVITTVGGVMPFLPVPEVQREELEELPPQLAQLLLEKPEPVVPPPPPPKPVEEVKPEPEPKVTPDEPTVAKPEAKVADAREKAAISGLLAFKDEFADMRDTVDMSKLQDTAAIQRGSGEAASIDRKLLTSKHSTRSAGVNVAALSSDTGGIALAGRETTKVDAPEGSDGTGGVRKPRTFDPRSRSIEEIRRVFDANKGAIFAIYNRALRQDPTLQGKLLIELVISPAGAVTGARVISSELADEKLVAKLINRVRLFDFGKRDVATTTISYPVHFLPT